MLFALFALMSWGITGCSEEEVEDIGIFGTWDLVKGNQFPIKSGMVSAHFSKNGKLEVVNNFEEQEEAMSWGDWFKPTGDYRYTVKLGRLFIEDLNFSWTINDSELKITENHVFKYNEYYSPHEYVFIKRNN